MSTDLYNELWQDRISSVGYEDNDCGVLALAVATGESYGDCHAAMELAGRKRGGGTYGHMYAVATDLLGYSVTEYFRGVEVPPWVNRCKTPITAEKNLPPKGGFILRVKRHAIGARDGKIHDWTEGRRHRIRSIIQVRKREL